MDHELWTASSEGDLLRVRDLLQHPDIGINLAAVDDARQDTPLHVSSRFGRTQVVQELLNDPRIDVNCPNKGGATPLYIACQEGHLEAAELLLRVEGIDVNWGARDGETPLFSACQNGHVALVGLLLRDERVDVMAAKKTGATALFMACQIGNAEIVRMLLGDVRINPNRTRNDGSGPLCIACWNGHHDVVSAMLAVPSVKVSHLGGNGASPLLFATTADRPDIVQLLLTHPELDVNEVRDPTNSTSLWHAAQNGWREVAWVLLASDQLVNTRVVSTFNQQTAAQQGRQQPLTPRGHHETDEDYKKRTTYGPVIADLIEQYEADPVAVRTSLRRLPQIRSTTTHQPFIYDVIDSISQSCW